MVLSRATIVPHLPVRIERAEVLHFLEYPEDHQPPARVSQLIDEVLPQARRLVQARGCFRQLPTEHATGLGLEPIEAEALVIGLVTIGDGIEQQTQQLSDAGQITKALVFDAAGSAAAEEAADRLSGLVARAQGVESADEERSVIGCRLSPGYSHWPITSQPALFAELPHQDLGVVLHPSCLMVPRKSISFALWLGARGPIAQGLAGCKHCSLKRCRYRRRRSPAQGLLHSRRYHHDPSHSSYPASARAR